MLDAVDKAITQAVALRSRAEAVATTVSTDIERAQAKRIAKQLRDNEISLIALAVNEELARLAVTYVVDSEETGADIEETLIAVALAHGIGAFREAVTRLEAAFVQRGPTVQ